jgi:hypothetical protein
MIAFIHLKIKNYDGYVWKDGCRASEDNGVESSVLTAPGDLILW